MRCGKERLYEHACKIHTNMHSIDASTDAVICSKHQSPRWTLVTLPDLNIYIWKRGTGTFIKSKPAKQRSQNKGRGHINYSPNLINISNHRCPVVESPLVPAVPLFDGLFLFLAHIMIFEFPLVTAGGEGKNCIVSNNFP